MNEVYALAATAPVLSLLVGWLSTRYARARKRVVHKLLQHARRLNR